MSQNEIHIKIFGTLNRRCAMCPGVACQINAVSHPSVLRATDAATVSLRLLFHVHVEASGGRRRVEDLIDRRLSHLNEAIFVMLPDKTRLVSIRQLKWPQEEAKAVDIKLLIVSFRTEALDCNVGVELHNYLCI